MPAAEPNSAWCGSFETHSPLAYGANQALRYPWGYYVNPVTASPARVVAQELVTISKKDGRKPP